MSVPQIVYQNLRSVLENTGLQDAARVQARTRLLEIFSQQTATPSSVIPPRMTVFMGPLGCAEHLRSSEPYASDRNVFSVQFRHYDPVIEAAFKLAQAARYNMHVVYRLPSSEEGAARLINDLNREQNSGYRTEIIGYALTPTQASRLALEGKTDPVADAAIRESTKIFATTIHKIVKSGAVENITLLDADKNIIYQRKDNDTFVDVQRYSEFARQCGVNLADILPAQSKAFGCKANQSSLLTL